jgi:hypothetical protein
LGDPSDPHDAVLVHVAAAERGTDRFLANKVSDGAHRQAVKENVLVGVLALVKLPAHL